MRTSRIPSNAQKVETQRPRFASQIQCWGREVDNGDVARASYRQCHTPMLDKVDYDFSSLDHEDRNIHLCDVVVMVGLNAMPCEGGWTEGVSGHCYPTNCVM